MSGIYDKINNVAITVKMNEKIKYYRTLYNEYTHVDTVEAVIMNDIKFKMQENMRIFFEVIAFLYGIKKTEEIMPKMFAKYNL